MAYHIEADIRFRWNTNHTTELADDDGSNTPDAGVIAAIIAGSDSEIFAIIGSRYPSADPATIVTVPAVLRDRAADLSIYYLKRRQERGRLADKEEIIAWFDKVADGTYIIPGLEPEQPESTADNRARVFSDREFSRRPGFGERLPAGGSAANENVDQNELLEDFLP